MGWEDAKDDFVILDGEKSVGRIHKDTTAPKADLVGQHVAFPAPPPNNGLAPTLEEQAAFKARYEEMKAASVRSFA
jgi:hypothetical protein